MPRYDKYGPQDDRVLEDIDLGFTGFNNRLRPDQLSAGVLAECNNGRLERNGQWQLRNGVDAIGAPIATGVSALILPFTLAADDTNASIAAPDSNSNNLVITNITGSLYADSGTINLSNVEGITPDPDGDQPYTKTATNTLTVAGGFSGSSADTAVTVKYPILNDNAVNEVYGACSFSDPNSQDNESYIIIATNVKAIAYKVSNPSVTFTMLYPAGATISAESNMIQAFNKLIIFRKGAVALEVDLSANNISDEPALSLCSNGDYSQPQVISTAAKDNAFINGIFTVVNSADVSVGQRITCVDSPNNLSGLFKTVGSDQVNFIAERTERARFTVKEVFEASSTTVNVTGVTVDETTITIACSGHGLKVNQPIEFKDLDAALTGNQVVAKVNSADEFEVEVNTTFTASDVTGTVQPAAGFSFLVQEDQKQSIRTQAQVRNSTPSFQRRVSQGLGYIHMPCPSFGILHQRRLVVPYQFDQTGSSGSASVSSRKVFDEVIVSDILDSNTYDKIFGSFRFNAGASDFTVGIVSFTEDSILIFNKNSIYRVSNTVNPNQATTQVLTNEIGALARKSIVQVGKNVFFLSDNGVYSLEFFDEYNLRGTQTPISEPIQATIDQIDQRFAKNATAVYFGNRYYIAVPLKTNPDGSQNDKGINNAILIYNFINNQWESIDTIKSTPTFEYTNLIIAGLGNARGVYCINQSGGIHLIASSDENFSTLSRTGFDSVLSTIGSTSPSTYYIDGFLKTRMYTYGDIGRKKYNSFDITAEGNEIAGADFFIEIETENIDTDLGTQKSDLGQASDYLGGQQIQAQTPPEDVAIRGRIGNMRAYGAQLKLSNKSSFGNFRIRNIKTAATSAFKSTNSAT